MNKEYKIDPIIYSDDIVKDSISAYADISEIKYNNNLLEINWETDSDIEEIFNEFMNYCIQLINEI